MKRPPCVHDGGDDVFLLVDFDGINAAINRLIFVFFDGILKARTQVAHARAQNIGKSHQQRQLDAALLNLVNQNFEIDRASRVAVGMHYHVAVFIHGKKIRAPLRDVVCLDGILNFPNRHVALMMV